MQKRRLIRVHKFKDPDEISRWQSLIKKCFLISRHPGFEKTVILLTIGNLVVLGVTREDMSGYMKGQLILFH